MNIVTYNTSNSRHTFISRVGFVVLGEFMKSLKLSELVDGLTPKSGRNCTYPSNTLFSIFMFNLHDGGRCMEDVRLLTREFALMRR